MVTLTESEVQEFCASIHLMHRKQVIGRNMREFLLNEVCARKSGAGVASPQQASDLARCITGSEREQAAPVL